ncbi:hypothetical protein DF268_07815 [Streptomyces sp. V2]|uniref:BtrH N-terminal domain-containing protein n=1 Tax=Streptomyces TaxID=1883 RepID=UPI00099F3991|nr:MULTISPECIES: BtrH N-terminal domain-containing protein [Streptomyces]PWG14134.1 hypothetical protein DF268_07815 [Streptomyces sp. V2]
MALRQEEPSVGFTSLDCITSTYGTVLRSLGYDPAALGECWGYHHAPMVEAEWPIEHLELRRRPIADTLRSWYGLDIEVERHPTVQQAWQTARGILDAGRLVIVLVDAFHLPYSGQYLRVHHPHRIVITGYSGAVVDVFDGYQGSLFEGQIDLSDLLAAMSAEQLAEQRRGDPDWRNWTITLRPGKGAHAKWTKAVFNSALKRNLDLFLSGAEEGAPAGCTRLRDCIEELRSAPSSFAELSPVGMLEVTGWFGELGSQRSLNARFLRAAGEALSLPRLGDCAEQAEELSKRWTMKKVYVYMRLHRRGAQAVSHIADRLEETAELEVLWSEDVRHVLHATHLNKAEPSDRCSPGPVTVARRMR